MIPRVMIVVNDDKQNVTEGYFLTHAQLASLVHTSIHDRDMIKNDSEYVTGWLKQGKSPFSTPDFCYAVRCGNMRCLKGDECHLNSRNTKK